MSRPQKAMLDRFFSKIDKRGPAECWLWTAGLNSAGYGIFRRATGMDRAHRISFEIANGVALKSNDFVCHRCDNRKCVNPAHLFVGTHLDNMRDMVSKGRLVSASARKTQCKRGHPFDETNTFRCRNGARVCIRCQRMHEATSRRRRKLRREATNANV